jgi:hypothetical protein
MLAELDPASLPTFTPAHRVIHFPISNFAIVCR